MPLCIIHIQAQKSFPVLLCVSRRQHYAHFLWRYLGVRADPEPTHLLLLFVFKDINMWPAALKE